MNHSQPDHAFGMRGRGFTAVVSGDSELFS